MHAAWKGMYMYKPFEKKKHYNKSAAKIQLSACRKFCFRNQIFYVCMCACVSLFAWCWMNFFANKYIKCWNGHYQQLVTNGNWISRMDCVCEWVRGSVYLVWRPFPTSVVYECKVTWDLNIICLCVLCVCVRWCCNMIFFLSRSTWNVNHTFISVHTSNRSQSWEHFWIRSAA